MFNGIFFLNFVVAHLAFSCRERMRVDIVEFLYGACWPDGVLCDQGLKKRETFSTLTGGGTASSGERVLLLFFFAVGGDLYVMEGTTRQSFIR